MGFLQGEERVREKDISPYTWDSCPSFDYTKIITGTGQGKMPRQQFNFPFPVADGPRKTLPEKFSIIHQSTLH